MSPLNPKRYLNDPNYIIDIIKVIFMKEGIQNASSKTCWETRRFESNHHFWEIKLLMINDKKWSCAFKNAPLIAGLEGNWYYKHFNSRLEAKRYYNKQLEAIIRQGYKEIL